jgi:cobalt/nickel transport system ATP-binding protein
MDIDHMNLIETTDLTYTYQDGTKALQNINLSIKKNDRIAILGPNGAGKSTLLKIISGLLFPFEGSVTILGNALKKKNVKNIYGKLGLLFQDPDDQIFMPNVWDDVAFGPINIDLDEKEIKKRVRYALNHTELTGFEKRVPHHLSFGEKKRVAIAGIIAMKPQILLLDEPTANLDSKTREEFMGVINTLKTTVIIATHDVNSAIRMADKAFVINTNQLAYGPIKDIFSNETLLKKAHLEPPTIMKLFIELNKQGYNYRIPSTIDEAIQLIRNKKP